MISQYNLPPENRYPITNLIQVVTKRLKIQGFIISDANMGPKYIRERKEKITSVSQALRLADSWRKTMFLTEKKN